MSSSSSIIKKRENNSILLLFANTCRKEGNFNDVVIEAGNEKISANRMVLACFSSYFDKMFKVQMKEKFQNTVVIQNIDSAILKTIVDYMYSGEILINNENATELLACADYLAMEELKEFCFEFLKTAMTTCNCLTILATANLYTNDLLKNHTLKFIKKNFGDIACSADFKNLAKSDLVLCINNLNRNHVKEAVISRSILDWTKHDEDNRKQYFSELWDLVNFNKLSPESISEIVSERLICANLAFSNMMNVRLVQLLKDKRVFENESKVVSFGGWGTKMKVIEVYCTVNKSSLTLPDLPVPMEAHKSLKLKNYVYCFGGYSFHSGISERVFRLQLNENCLKWEEMASLNERRQNLGATVFNDCIVVAGGRNGGKVLASTEIYCPQTDEWKYSVSLKPGRSGNELVVCDDCLYSIGGFSGGKYLGYTERLDEVQGFWEPLAPMHTPRDLFAVVNCGGEVFAIGGVTENNKVVKSVERYNADINKWIFVCDMHIERCRHSASVLHDQIYVVGGVKSEGKVVKEIECYDTKLDKWEIVTTNKEELINHGLTVI